MDNGRVWSLKSIATLKLALTTVVSLTTVIALRVSFAGTVLDIEREGARADRIVHAVDARLTGMLNAEVGLRGYVATAEASFLRPYHEGRAAELRSRRALEAELTGAEKASLAVALAQADAAVDDWFVHIAEPEIEAAPLDELAVAFREGKHTFDRFRIAHDRVRTQLARWLEQRQRSDRSRLSRQQWIAALVILSMIFFNLLVGLWLWRNTTRPLARLAEMAALDAVSVAALEPIPLREVHILAQALERLLDNARDRALRDGLTRVYNRAFLAEYLPRQLRQARRDGIRLSAVMIDVDHFKRINDEHGHEAGDRVLVAVARCLEREVRDSDVVVRYGGEEFAVILPVCDEADAAMVAERLRAAVASLEERDGLPTGVRVTCSAGVATADPAGAGLLGQADQALYAAKRAGRDRVVRASAHRPLLVAVA